MGLLRFFAGAATCVTLVAGCKDPVAAVDSSSPKSTGLTVTVGPSNTALGVCGTYQLTLSVSDSAQLTTAVPPDSTRWRSSDTTVLAVSGSGVARGLKASPALTPDTVQATAWYGKETGTGRQTFIIEDGRTLIGPCPGNGVTSCYVPPCSWSH